MSLVILAISTNGSVWGETNLAWRNANEYSPIVDSIPIPLATQKMKGTLIDYAHDIFRQPPSREVDAAWDALTAHGFTYVSESAAQKMGWDLSVTAQLPSHLLPETAQGPHYSGETDMIHKLHCLDMIRKDVYFDYYWLEMYPNRNVSERHRIHSSHCLYIILQALMCDANTDLIPHVYLEDYAWPVPDFEIKRKCGNFEGVKEWQQAHDIPLNESTTKALEKKPGQKSRPITDEFRRLFEVDEP
ncbi:hypothetical protein N0V90_007745 [Kalmusia sp. IMI 367209]|nr:hypothetical protein N0V90_007745 [Kalmusia sp. IMI 367209]